MALSNIRREPRREITEQVIGTIVVVAFLSGDFYLANRFPLAPYDHRLAANIVEHAFMMFNFALMTVVAGAVIAFLIHGIHAIGELVCGLLASHNLDPRPKRRY